MKRTCVFLFIIISVLISFVGCDCTPSDSLTQSTNTEFSSNITMPAELVDPMYTDGSMSVFKTNDSILVELYFPKHATIQFLTDRTCIDNGGINLINNESLQTFLGKELQSVGGYHIDLGSGFFIPSYITTDGYMISFYVDENNIIYSAIKKDLFTNMTVEDTACSTGDGSMC